MTVHRRLCDIRCFELPPCAVPDVAESIFLARHRASVGIFFQAEDGLLETSVPFQGGLGMLSVDVPVQVVKVAPSAGGDVNDVCHAWLRTRRKTPSQAESFLFSRR